MSRRNKNTEPLNPPAQNVSTTDAFSNPLFRLGYGSQSPLEATEYPLTRMTDNYALLNSLYRDNWVVQNVVGLVVDDMLREWYKLNGSIAPKYLTEWEKAEQKIGLRGQIRDGMQWGRLYGGAAGLIRIQGQESMLDQPLDLDTVMPGSFSGLMILDRWCGITPDMGLVKDMRDPDFNLPEYYMVNNAEGQLIARVHHSRIVRFTGRDLPYLERIAELYWGESEIEALYKDVVAHDNVSANIAALVFQANVNTMEVQNLEHLFSLGSKEQQRRFWNVMQNQSVLRTNFGVQLVNKGDQIHNTQYSFGGLKDVYETMCLNLCGASHIPMTKLFGRSPAGMNATGESDLQNYYDYINSQRESKLRPALERLLPVMAMSVWGMVPEDLQIDFPPLWTPTAKEIAEIAKAKAEAVISVFQAGLIRADSAQKELKKLEAETGLFGSITDEEIKSNAGKTYQDITALRDPLAGLGLESLMPESEETAPFEGAAQDAALYAADRKPDYIQLKNGKMNGSRPSGGKSGLTSGGENATMQSSPSATGTNRFEKGFGKANLQRHIKKHGSDYPGLTPEEYDRYALELIQQPVSKDVLGYKTADGAVVRYRISTNDFVKGYLDGGIATMYKPKGDHIKGLKYYRNQEKKEGILND